MTSKLEIIELIDNFVSDVNNIRVFYGGFKNLKELSFQQSGANLKGSNPMCDSNQYEINIKTFCSTISKIDGVIK